MIQGKELIGLLSKNHVQDNFFSSMVNEIILFYLCFDVKEKLDGRNFFWICITSCNDTIWA